MSHHIPTVPGRLSTMFAGFAFGVAVWGLGLGGLGVWGFVIFLVKIGPWKISTVPIPSSLQLQIGKSPVSFFVYLTVHTAA